MLVLKQLLRHVWNADIGDTPHNARFGIDCHSSQKPHALVCQFAGSDFSHVSL